MPTLKQLARIQSSDEALNRVQDQLASALNPILRNVKGDLSGPLESPTVKALQGVSLSPATPSNGQTLVYNNGEWAPGTTGGVVTLAGDVTGPSTATVVERIQGQPVSSAAPNPADVLTWDGAQWEAAPIPTPVVTLAGDVTGPASSNTVEAIQNTPVSAAAPSTNDVLLYSGTEWVPTPQVSLVYPKPPPAWGTEFLWWKLDDASQPGTAANTVVNYGSYGAATLTSTVGGAFSSKLPALEVPQNFQKAAYSKPVSPAAYFSGANAAIPAAGTALTASCWMTCQNDSQNFYFFQKFRTAGTRTVSLFTVSQRLQGSIYTATLGSITTFSVDGFLAPHSINFVAMTYDGANLRLYVNGRQVATTTATGNLDWNPASPLDWRIGVDTTSGGSGCIWDVRIATSVRTEAQLLSDYKYGMGYIY